MKTFTVTTKRTYCTKYAIQANTAEEAEQIVRDMPIEKHEEKDMEQGNCISMDIESDAL